MTEDRREACLTFQRMTRAQLPTSEYTMLRQLFQKLTSGLSNAKDVHEAICAILRRHNATELLALFERLVAMGTKETSLRLLVCPRLRPGAKAVTDRDVQAYKRKRDVMSGGERAGAGAGAGAAVAGVAGAEDAATTGGAGTGGSAAGAEVEGASPPVAGADEATPVRRSPRVAEMPAHDAPDHELVQQPVVLLIEPSDRPATDTPQECVVSLVLAGLQPPHTTPRTSIRNGSVRTHIPNGP